MFSSQQYKPRAQPQLLRHYKAVKDLLKDIEVGMLKNKLPSDLRQLLESGSVPRIYEDLVVDFLCLLGISDGALSLREADFVVQTIDGSPQYDYRAYLEGFCGERQRRYRDLATAPDRPFDDWILRYRRFLDLLRESVLFEEEVTDSATSLIRLAGMKLALVDEDFDNQRIMSLSSVLSQLDEQSQSNTKIHSGKDGTARKIDELFSLVGLTRVKQEVSKLVNFAKIQGLRRQAGLPSPDISNHLVFVGNPGTGKTVVARMLGEIYAELGILTRGQLIECDRSSLVAGYVGQTALKTREALEQAKGGILFIDEAYALSNSSAPNDYGQEAIETILKFMEDQRDNLVVIAAGYSRNMVEFLNSNPGLHSRFSKVIAFEDYNDSELFEIFKRFVANAGYSMDGVAADRARSLMKNIYDLRGDNFGNARDVRNIFDLAIQNHADRVASMGNASSEDLATIKSSDIPGCQ